MEINKVSKVYPVLRILKGDSLINPKTKERDRKGRNFEKTLLLKKRERAVVAQKDKQNQEPQ